MQQRSYPIEDIASTLDALADSSTKLDLIRKLYIAPDRELVELLLQTVGYDESIVAAELATVLDPHSERFQQLAQQSIDHYTNLDPSQTANIKPLAHKLKQWDNAELNAYASLQLKKWDKEGSMANDTRIAILESKALIQEAIASPDLTSTLETILQLQQVGAGTVYHICETLVKLGRYDEAIDIYTKQLLHQPKENYLYAKQARSIAKEHAPSRQKEIAQFVTLRPMVSGYEVLFYECCEYVNKIQTARTYMEQLVDKLLYNQGLRGMGRSRKRVSGMPQNVHDILRVMVQLDCFQEGINLITKDFEDFLGSPHIWVGNANRQMGELYAIIGDQEKSLIRFDKSLQEGLQRDEKDRKHVLSVISKVQELWGPNHFQEYHLQALEMTGDFTGAAALATEMGDMQKVQAYKVLGSLML